MTALVTCLGFTCPGAMQLSWLDNTYYKCWIGYGVIRAVGKPVYGVSVRYQQRGAGLGHGIHVDRGTYRIGEYINEDQLRRLLSHLFANCD